MSEEESKNKLSGEVSNNINSDEGGAGNFSEVNESLFRGRSIYD